MKIKDTRRHFIQFTAMPIGTWFLRGGQPSLKLTETTGYNGVMRVVFVIYNPHREQYLPIHWGIKEIRDAGPRVPFGQIKVGQLFGDYWLKVDHLRAFNLNNKCLVPLALDVECDPLEAEFVF